MSMESSASELKPLDKSAQRRSRGEISCAECRRLRIKCDKIFPCKMCIRRGCGHLCPHGTSTPADGTRLVLAATEGLHDNIAHLRRRIRDLETSLNSLHLTRTGHTHPLLALSGEDDDLKGEDPEDDTQEPQTSATDESALIRGQDGAHRIAGAFGKSWVAHAVEQDMAQLSAPAVLAGGIRHWPFIPYPPIQMDLVAHLRHHLPPDHIRDGLLDVFWSSVGHSVLGAFDPQYLHGTLVPKALQATGSRALVALCALFAVMGIGALFAVDGPGETPEVGRFGRLCAGGLTGVGTLATPSVEIVEAMYARVMLELFRQAQLEEPTRSLFAVAASMTLVSKARSTYVISFKHQTSIGLSAHADRDLPFLNCSPDEVEHRRLVFWMIFKTDAWECMSMGRPPIIAFSRQFIDARFPGESAVTAEGSTQTRALARANTIVAEIGEATMSLHPPTYSKILELDSRLRLMITGGFGPMTPAIVATPSILLMYLHRAFYARALTQNSDDPFKSEYSYSVHAVLRSARDTVLWLNAIVKQAPAQCARLHYLWNMALTAAMVYKLLLDQAPEFHYAEEARMRLNMIITVFECGAKYGSGRAKRALVILSSREMRTSGSNSAPLEQREASPEISRDSRGAGPSSLKVEEQNTVTWNPDLVPAGLNFPFGDLRRPNPASSMPDQHPPPSSGDRRAKNLGKSTAPKQKGPKRSTKVTSEHKADTGGHGITSSDATEADPSELTWPSEMPHASINEVPPASTRQFNSGTGDPDLPYYDGSPAQRLLNALWDGFGWHAMVQGAMPLSVPQPPHALAISGNDGTQWLDSLGAYQPGMSGSLNGEWNANFM